MLRPTQYVVEYHNMARGVAVGTPIRMNLFRKSQHKREEMPADIGSPSGSGSLWEKKRVRGGFRAETGENLRRGRVAQRIQVTQHGLLVGTEPFDELRIIQRRLLRGRTHLA